MYYVKSKILRFEKIGGIYLKKHYGKIVLIILSIIAVLFLLYPTYQASQLEELQAKAEKRALQAEQAGNPDEAFRIREEFMKTYGEDLKKAKQNRLKLGLDLRGGMYVTLEVDVIKLIEESAIREAIDETFEKVIEVTKEQARKSDEDALDLFLKNFNSIARPKGKSLISYFDLGDLKDASEEKIIEKLKDNSSKAIDQALEVMRQRIDKYGVAEPNIQKQGVRRILLELPGVTNESEMRDLLQTTARLEFKLVRNNEQIVKAFYKIDQLVASELRRKSVKGDAIPEQPIDTSSAEAESRTRKELRDTTQIVQKDTIIEGETAKSDTSNPYAGLPEEEAVRKYLEDHPFTSLFATYYLPGPNERPVPFSYINPNIPEGEFLFRISGDSIEKFNSYLRKPNIKALIPFDLEIAISAKPDRIAQKQNVIIYDLYCLKKDPELTGDVVTDARATFDPTTNAPEVLMAMNDEGAERWSRITGANIKKRISIDLDGRVYSAPVVQARITGGRSSITGMANLEEANLLEIVLKAGALKAPVQIIEERVVGPSLGDDSIRSGVTASWIAIALVFLYMIFYYVKGGGIAVFAVILNITMVLAVLSAFGGTLTLPGIAGIILTIGMAVDANVLIFERIREELYKGRSIRSAIDDGFRKALSAIIDSNITTLLTAFILFYFGTGPIQGFAMTLMIGIFSTLFTGILITRAIIELFMARDSASFNFGQPKIVEA